MKSLLVTVPDATVLYIRGWMQMVLLPYYLFSWNKWQDGEIQNMMPWDIIAVYIQNGNFHSDYILCARWVLLVTPDSSSSFPGCSMRVLPPSLLLINSLSCSPLGGRALPHSPLPGWPHFPQCPGTYPLLRRLQLQQKATSYITYVVEPILHYIYRIRKWGLQQ
jgi:hypothetical protein